MENTKHPLALGQAAQSVAQAAEPKSDTERIEFLERQLEAMVTALAVTRMYISDTKKPRKEAVVEINKHGLPLGHSFFGTTSNAKGSLFMLTVAGDGSYVVGVNKYNSLSQAAEAVSGVRRSGWTFWRTAGGQTLKEAFNK